MRVGWQISKLGTLCSVRRDSGIHNDMNYIGLEHISSGTGCLISVSDTSDVIGTTNLFREGDVLYGKLRPYLKKVVVADFEGCCSTEILPIRCGDSILPHFLKYWFLEDGITDKINATCGGCRMPRANMRDVFGLEFAFPSLPEQQRIVDILDQEFAKIDTLKANAEKSLQAAMDLFQATLKKKLERKKGWHQAGLKSICKALFAGGDAPKGNMSKTRTPGYNIPILSNGIGDNAIYGFTNIARVFDKSITISARGTIGYVSIRNTPFFPIVRLIVATPGDDVQAEYLKYFLSTISFQSDGTAIPQLTVPMVKDLMIDYPSIEDQQSIVISLDDLNDRCQSLQENYQKTLALCDDLKQSLLRKAFNGEL